MSNQEKINPFDEFKNYLSQFECVGETEWEHLSSILRLSHLKKGDHVLRAGEISDQANFVVNGFLKSYIVGGPNETTWNIYFPGMMATDYKSYLNGLPTAINIIALAPTTVIQLNRRDIDELVRKFPHLSCIMTFMANDAFMDMRERVESFLLRSPEERYMDTLEKNPKLVLSLTNKDLATYLGITPQSLSRIKSRALRSK